MDGGKESERAENSVSVVQCGRTMERSVHGISGFLELDTTQNERERCRSAEQGEVVHNDDRS